MGTEVFGAEIDSQMGSSPLDWRFDHILSLSVRTNSTTRSRRSFWP